METSTFESTSNKLKNNTSETVSLDKKTSAGSAALLAELSTTKSETLLTHLRQAEALQLGLQAIRQVEIRPSQFNRVETVNLDGAKIAVELPSVIPFDKNVLRFSKAELLQTAKKINLGGDSLSELLGLGRIDEAGLRRIVGEFLTGGDVQAALKRELQQREMAYERDPRLRRSIAAAGQMGMDGVLLSQDSIQNQNWGSQGIDKSASMTAAAGSSRQFGITAKPIPDQATTMRLKKQQLTAIAVVVGVLVALIFVLLSAWYALR